MILPGQGIRSMELVKPCHRRREAYGRSYGLGPASYDVRIAQTIWLWPFWGRLASTMERFTMPDNIAGMVKDKSTNARNFILVQNTFIDPGWCGYLTLELTRFLPWPVRIRAGTPIAQIVFMRLEGHAEAPYCGKYQNQEPGPQRAIQAR